MRLTPEAIGNYFNGKPQNIGVLLGEPSGWLIDIDLDHVQAVVEAENFLPATGAIFGRASKRRSHWLYRATSPIATHKRQHAETGMIVELRSTGAQTVFPPSVHQSGEPIEWHTYGEPLEIEPGELRAAVVDVEHAGPAAEGAVLPVIVDPGENWPAFEDTFRKRFQRNPDFAAAGTYDAVQLLVAAVRRAGLNRARIGDALRALSPWDGVAGSVRWDALGGNTRPIRLGTVSAGRLERFERPLGTP